MGSNGPFGLPPKSVADAHLAARDADDPTRAPDVVDDTVGAALSVVEHSHRELGDQAFIEGRFEAALREYAVDAGMAAPGLASDVYAVDDAVVDGYTRALASAVVAHAVLDPHPSEGKRRFRPIALAVSELAPDLRSAFVRLGIDMVHERGVDPDLDAQVDLLRQGDVLSAIASGAVPGRAVVGLVDGVAHSDLASSTTRADAHALLGAIYAGDEAVEWVRDESKWFVFTAQDPTRDAGASPVAVDGVYLAQADSMRTAQGHFEHASALYAESGSRAAAVLVDLRAIRVAEQANAIDPTRAAPALGHGIT